MLHEGSMMSNLILNILSLLILGVFVGVVYSLVYSIFIFIFSGGDDSKIKKAWNSIRYFILGFILTLIVLFAIPGLLRALKVPGYEQYSSSNVFNNAKDWVLKIFEVFDQSDDNFIESENYEL